MPRGLKKPSSQSCSFSIQLLRALPRMYKCRLESFAGWFPNPPIPAPTYSENHRLIDRSDDHFPVVKPQPPNVKDLMADTMDLLFRPSSFLRFLCEKGSDACDLPIFLCLMRITQSRLVLRSCRSFPSCNQTCVLCTTFTLLTFYLSDSLFPLLFSLFISFLLSSLYSVTPSCRSALGRRRSHYQTWLLHQVGGETSSLPH